MVVPAGTSVWDQDHAFRAGIPGGVAQLGERLNGIQEVRGSIPLASTGPAAGKHGVRVGVRRRERAGIAQLVEHNLAKVGVAGSSPVSRSGQWLSMRRCAWRRSVGRLAQLVRAPR